MNLTLTFIRMDSLTQIVLGAAVGEAVAGRKMGAKAAEILLAVRQEQELVDVVLPATLTVRETTASHRTFSTQG